MITSSGLSVSVAMATYNGAKYVRDQIRSIVTQTHLPDEIVICDDASTDLTMEYLYAIQQEFPSLVRIYHNEENRGYSRNFEKVVSLCRGELIFLSDQDDSWFPQKLERIVNVFGRNPQCGLVFSDAELADHALNPKGYTVYSHYRKPDLCSTQVVPNFLREIRVLGCTSAFRARYLPYLLPISSLWGHDHWIAFILSAISQLEMVDEPLMLYRRHDQNVGNALAWEQNIFTRVRRRVQNLSLEREMCQHIYEGWEAMLDQLRRVQEMNAKEIHSAALERAIVMVEAKSAFSRHRWMMATKPRLFRIAPAFHLYKSGDYERYSAGSHTIIRDLLM